MEKKKFTSAVVKDLHNFNLPDVINRHVLLLILQIRRYQAACGISQQSSLLNALQIFHQIKGALLSLNSRSSSRNERGDVPGWVLVVLMTAGLVTGIWTLAAPRLNLILRNSLDSMNAIR